MYTDTIAAISTPLGEGGISVIRVSGFESIEIIEKIFNSKSVLSKVPSHTVHYGHLIDPKSLEILDEVLITVMRAPRTFTMENTVEISCHGGIIITNQVLQLILDQGVRLAEPGEFTKRAFLNGRIDLTKAEAVIDFIRSKSLLASKNFMKQMKGDLFKQIESIRYDLIQLIAHIEVNIDYPEHDIQEITNEFIQKSVNMLLDKLDSILKYSTQGTILKEGIRTAIIGKPNVGKSSLLNRFAHENKSIVTDIPGTTRDVIEQYVTIRDIPLLLLDTAGIRETNDFVEKIGVERSKTTMEEANLVLLLLNNNEKLQQTDIDLISDLKSRTCIVVVNKVDLPTEIDMDYLYATLSPDRVVQVSILHDKGINNLEEKIKKIFFDGDLSIDDFTYVSNARQIHLLKKTRQFLLDASDSNNLQIPIDIIQLDLRAAWENLGEIIGDSVSESLIDQIFSQFCLGK